MAFTSKNYGDTTNLQHSLMRLGSVNEYVSSKPMRRLLASSVTSFILVSTNRQASGAERQPSFFDGISRNNAIKPFCSMCDSPHTSNIHNPRLLGICEPLPSSTTVWKSANRLSMDDRILLSSLEGYQQPTNEDRTGRQMVESTITDRSMYSR